MEDSVGEDERREQATANGEDHGHGGLPSTVASSTHSDVVASLSVSEQEIMEVKDQDQEARGETEAEQAGLLSTVATKIRLAMTGANGSSSNEDDVETSNGNGDAAACDKSEEERDGGSGGGIIKQLISNLPASLPASDDQAPEADEASLLISIIED